MTKPVKDLVAGAVTLVVGLVLWLFTGGVDMPVISPPKVGIVLMCLGALEALFGLYQWARARRA
ncbi:DUF5708 family protein [Streptomyces sp. 15-116A]|uniref:DUF5708 family protein n=1 Tax=Streptomyces sp. 15-116A TaxID=2259035 RepID=UPI0021B1FFAB|nr:DUF5708 family protein [Streptomyces sp. 15-116A]MCT7353081.1 DUF5708 family protein [Streptomyces sp. 15-116A]